MADYKVTDTQLTNIANAIRTKGGTSEQLEFPTEFISAVNAISGVTAADEGKVVSNGVLVAQQSGSATANGTVDTTLINSLSVNVPQTVVMPISLTVTPPTKAEYDAGDTLDLTGIAVVANYSDGTTAVVTGDCTFSPDDGDTLDTSGDVTITATYNGTGSVSGGSYSVQLTGTTSVHVSAVIDIVPWATGTDEQIVAMLEAAHNGDIDLQTDGGWAVGDVRRIHVNSFWADSYDGKSSPAQDIDIAISQFGDYMNCGCVVQFDFAQCLSKQFFLNSSASTAGGYGSCTMKTASLPALVNALPSWLKNSLIEFSVLAAAGNGSSTINTVTGNKLALRSEVELTGSQSHGSASGEGSQIDYYKSGTLVRTAGPNGSAIKWVTRSTSIWNASYYIMIQYTGVPTGNSPNAEYGVIAFGCL